MLKGAMQDMISQVVSAIQAVVPGNFSTMGSKPIRQQNGEIEDWVGYKESPFQKVSQVTQNIQTKALMSQTLTV